MGRIITNNGYMIGYALMSILWGHVVIRYLVKIRV